VCVCVCVCVCDTISLIVLCFFSFNIFNFMFLFLIGYFLIYISFLLGSYFIYISNAIPKVPHMLPHPLPHPPTPTSWPSCSPVLRHIKFARLMGLSFHRWPTRPFFDSYAARDTSSRGVLVSSYCCSTYRIADPFSSFGPFFSSFIGGPVIHPIADCEHPLLCLLGPGIVSQETAISGSKAMIYASDRKLCF
jgi:hypothetical protein